MDKLFKSRKFRLLLACISLLLLLDMIQDTYAKYISSAEATGNFTIARWNFLINSQDVLANSDFSNTIIPVFTPNSNIANNVIAPTSTGYFEITIDYSNVDVAFDEQIVLSPGASNTVSDIIFTEYVLNSVTTTTLSNTSNATITTTHNLNEQNTVNTYRFYIEWLDGTGETMNNSSDTQASVNGSASIQVNVNFTQRASQNQIQNSDPAPEPEPDPDPNSNPNQG